MVGHVGVITQARTRSTRLPGKVLRRVGDRTFLEVHLDRLRSSGLDVHVATSDHEQDDEIADLARRLDVPCFRGSEHDVLSRFKGCAEQFALDPVVRVTSDCPLVDGALVADGIARFTALEDPLAYVSNGLERSFPRGLDFEVFSMAGLRLADEMSTTAAQREHVTPYLYSGLDSRVSLHPVTRRPDRSSYRLTLDTPEDLTLLTDLIETHHLDRAGTEEIIAFLDRHPELVAITAGVQQKPVTSAQQARPAPGSDAP